MEENNVSFNPIGLKHCENVGYDVIVQKTDKGDKCLSSHLCPEGQCENK